MTWPRVDGLRALELGSPGETRARLNGFALAGRKRATAGLVSEYEHTRVSRSSTSASASPCSTTTDGTWGRSR